MQWFGDSKSDSRYNDDPLINATKIYDTSHYL